MKAAARRIWGSRSLNCSRNNMTRDFPEGVCVCVCVCVCERERERERDRQTETEGEMGCVLTDAFQ